MSRPMNWLRKGLIALVVGLFLFNHRAAVVKQYRDNTPVLTSEEITELVEKVDMSYKTAKEKIAAGTYTPLDWQRDVYFWQVKILRQMGGQYNEERFFVLAGQAHEYAEKHYYRPNEQDKLSGLLFRQEVNQAQAQVLAENGERVDWSKILQKLHRLMLVFLPYSLLIILVRRSTRYKLWQIVSAGDIIWIIVATGLSIFGAVAYRPDNFLQKRIDSQLQIWKEKIGAHGWRLGLAYLVAIVVSLATLIRPAKSQTQMVVETKIVSIVPADAATNQEEESDEQIVFFPEKIVGFLRRTFEEVMRGIEIIVFSFFFLTITQTFPLPLEYVCGLWARPPDEIRFWIARAIGSRAPADFVLVANSQRTWTKFFTGAYYENQNVFCTRPGSGFFCHC